MSTFAVDKLYYIMDYNSNCYRLNSNDQLVVAGNETEATVFTFTEANKRIGSGTKSRFYFMTPVNTVDDEDVVDDEDDELMPEEGAYNLTDAFVSTVKELTDGEYAEAVEKSISEYDISKIDWQEYLTHFSYIASGIKEYRESLIKAQSDVDQKICDVIHYIELCDTNTQEATELVELLKVCTEKRRVIKDEIFKVDNFQRNIGTNANVAKAKVAIKAIKGLETRKYTPRKFTELFDGSKVKVTGSKGKSTDICLQKSEREERNIQEDCDMDYQRSETVFDGKKNDWMAFAMQQAEFYKNAGQYIVNMRLDIESIDSRIEALMNEIETANCNVAQGYKMFKHLKELRLERKEKEKELECLYILTEHFDMSAMSEECDSNVEELGRFLYGDANNQDDENPDTEDSAVEDTIINIAI